MSVTTSVRMNDDQFGAQIPGGAWSKTGARLQDAASKTIIVVGMTDQALQTAINTAAAAFVDREANVATLLSKASTALATNATFLGLGSPTNAQTLAQVQALTRQVNALIKLQIGQFDDTTGT